MNPDFIALAQQVKRHVVLPESTDDRILKAAVEVDQNNIASITVLKKNGFIIEKEAEDNLYWRLNKK